jgi:hypothetical protein
MLEVFFVQEKNKAGEDGLELLDHLETVVFVLQARRRT